MLTLPPGPYSAYLFDLDGTVADSMPLHYLAWKQAITEHGGTFPERLFYQYGGIPLLRVVELLNERYGTTLHPRAIVDRKESLYLGMLDRLEPVADVLTIIEAQSGKIPFAIVSGSPRASIRATLTQLGLLHHFPVIIGMEDYTHGKPHPEPFLTAARLLHAAPERCLVFEDAEAGIASARAAGMDCVRIPAPTFPAEDASFAPPSPS